LTVTRPATMTCSLARREATPASARNFCNRTTSANHTSALVLRRPVTRSPTFHWPRRFKMATRSNRFMTLRLAPEVVAARRLRCCDIISIQVPPRSYAAYFLITAGQCRGKPRPAQCLSAHGNLAFLILIVIFILILLKELTSALLAVVAPHSQDPSGFPARADGRLSVLTCGRRSTASGACALDALTTPLLTFWKMRRGVRNAPFLAFFMKSFFSWRKQSRRVRATHDEGTD